MSRYSKLCEDPGFSSRGGVSLEQTHLLASDKPNVLFTLNASAAAGLGSRREQTKLVKEVPTQSVSVPLATGRAHFLLSISEIQRDLLWDFSVLLLSPKQGKLLFVPCPV